MSDILPAYFELSWSILSTIGLINVFFGFMVLGIVGQCLIVTVPIVVSAAGALANGLCYVAFYTNYGVPWRITASVLADIGWLVSPPE